MVTVIIGYPGVGKTTYAKDNFDKVIHADNFIGKTSWDNMPKVLLALVKGKKDVAIEGVGALRMLRTALRDHDWEPDKVEIIHRADFTPAKNHKSMCKSIDTILNSYLDLNPTCTIEHVTI